MAMGIMVNGTLVKTNDGMRGKIVGTLPSSNLMSVYYLVEFWGSGSNPKLAAIEEYENNEIYPAVLPYHESSITRFAVPVKKA